MNAVAALPPKNGVDEFLVQFALKRALVTDGQMAQVRHALSGAQGDMPAWRTHDEAALLRGMVGAGMLKPAALARRIAEEFGLAYVAELPETPLRREVLERIPAEFARRHRIIPLAHGKSWLRFAIDHPFDRERMEAIRAGVGVELDPVIGAFDEIDRAVALNYPSDDCVVNEDAGPLGKFERNLTDHGRGGIAAGCEQGLSPAEDEPITELVRKLIADALQRRASDLHLEPMAGALRVRHRVDGILREVATLARELHPAAVSRVKILSGLSIGEKRRPQDGRLRFDRGGTAVDLRVSVVPTSHGESVVLRVLDDSRVRLGLAELGLEDADRAVWQQLTARSEGLLLVTGPTGSGKTTTLYSVLNRLNAPGRKLVTVEDPVESQIAGINQVAVRPEIGMTFARALRALLRQAPNVLMVGEIRDRETAELAANAGNTGHLVFSTLHTNDACGAVTRLLDLGLKPYMIAAALKGVLAQRLVRRICRHCRRPVTPAPAERRLIERLSTERESHRGVIFRGAGCEHCAGTGYAGRIGLFEVLVLDSEMQAGLHGGTVAAALRDRWRARGGRTLREDGIDKVRRGLTTLEEVLSATQSADVRETNL